MQVTDEQYNIVREVIDRFEKDKPKYKFNIVGLCAAGFNKKIRWKNYFYCAEFVKYALEQAGVKTNLPEVVKPEHFKKMEGLEEIYTGLLREYKITKKEKLYI